MNAILKKLTALSGAILMATALSFSCNSEEVTKENYAKIKNGMTVKEVQKILGEPITNAEAELPGIGLTELHHYQNGLVSVDIWYRKGKVSAKNWTKL